MADTRDRLLDATGHVLAREGYAGLTTQAVADEVGVSHPAVHYHFDTKADLVAAFAERTRDDILSGLRESDAQSPGERLAVLLGGLVGSPDDDERQIAFTRALLALHVRAPHDDRLQEILAGMDREVTGIIADTIAAGIEAGEFTDVDPESTAQLLLCALDGAAIRGYALDADVTPEVARGLVDHVLADLYVDEPPSLRDGVEVTR